MNNKDSKLYIIYACVDRENEMYIGSNTKALAKRMSGNRSSCNYKYISSSIHFDNMELENLK
jgi:hypothetical protein